MADKTDLKIRFEGKIAEFERFLSKETKAILNEEMKKATLKNALFMQAEIRRSILSKEFKKNASITQAIKGEDFPLKDSGHMVNMLAAELRNAFTAFVGYFKTINTSHGGQMKRVVELLQEGFEIKITPAIRRFLFFKLREAGGTPGQGGPSTGVIRVPGRPFLKKAFEDKKLRDKMNKNWEAAVQTALRRVKAL